MPRKALEYEKVYWGATFSENGRARMEELNLFTAAKWEILEALAENSKSPIELAELSKISVSNISQSLRFLELAGIVKSKRVSNRDKGQPRIKYSISEDAAYLIVMANKFVQKKKIKLNPYKTIILKIWMYEDEQLHPFLEQAVKTLIEDLPNIQGIYLDTTSVRNIKLILHASNYKKTLKPINIEWHGATRQIQFEIQNEVKPEQYYAIYSGE